jgi:hypothetical protein
MSCKGDPFPDFSKALHHTFSVILATIISSLPSNHFDKVYTTHECGRPQF